jgi:pimeloyl-ACP methyl ester carboxylesterase
MPHKLIRLPANGLNFHLAVAGRDTAPLVVLLHGFPEFWFGWRHQIDALAEAGWRVAAPDQRGYAESDKPVGAERYVIDILADDVLALADVLKADKFVVVGHDWGGMVSWHLAARNPERLLGEVMLNAPHPATFGSFAFSHPSRIAKSAYIALFQMPWLPELMLSAYEYAALSMALTRTSRPGTFDDDAIARYRNAWAEEGALTTMLNWYRAIPMNSAQTNKIKIPVRVIWGDSDSALDPGLAEAGLAYCERGEAFHIAGASHWLHHEEPEQVSTLLKEFLGRVRLGN